MGRHRRTSGEPLPKRSGTRSRGTRRRAAVVRTGLISVSALIAMGAVAVASGLLPGDSTSNTAGDGPTGGTAQSRRLPDLEPQGTPSSATPSGRASTSAEPSTGLPRSPGATPSQSRSRDRLPAPSSTSPSRQSSEPAPSRSASTSAPTTSAPATPSTETAAESQVVTLVNQERRAAGCRPVTADPKLARLAGDYSDDMAERGSFSPTYPDGADPWDRAAELGVTGLGGENIARGQRDAQAVMNTWMNSSRNRAHILNCDFRTIGVGVHFGDGGPWWTQDFGR